MEDSFLDLATERRSPGGDQSGTFKLLSGRAVVQPYEQLCCMTEAGSISLAGGRCISDSPCTDMLIDNAVSLAEELWIFCDGGLRRGR